MPGLKDQKINTVMILANSVIHPAQENCGGSTPFLGVVPLKTLAYLGCEVKQHSLDRCTV